MNASTLLVSASCLVQDAETAVLARDELQADRLHLLVRALDHEAEYARGVERGLPQVTPRVAPPGRTLAWYLRHDPQTRALRRVLGLWVPDR